MNPLQRIRSRRRSQESKDESERRVLEKLTQARASLTLGICEKATLTVELDRGGVVAVSIAED